jgi:hypothetical protein
MLMELFTRLLKCFCYLYALSQQARTWTTTTLCIKISELIMQRRCEKIYDYYIVSYVWWLMVIYALVYYELNLVLLWEVKLLFFFFNSIEFPNIARSLLFSKDKNLSISYYPPLEIGNIEIGFLDRFIFSVIRINYFDSFECLMNG